MRYQAYHDEVADALRAIGNARLGEAIRADRGSEMEYLGVRFPDLRKRVKTGFSFSHLPPTEVLEIWDDLWHKSPYGDVLFAALESCTPQIREHRGSHWWPTMQTWLPRVDNWCHCDQLAGLYSHLLEQDHVRVYPQLVAWNSSEALWEKRASLVSLVHYSGKNAVFLEPEQALPLVQNCLTDTRHYIQTAVGWVLREICRPYEKEVIEFLEAHIALVSSIALTRATEHLDPAIRAQLRSCRKQSQDH